MWPLNLHYTDSEVGRFGITGIYMLAAAVKCSGRLRRARGVPSEISERT